MMVAVNCAWLGALVASHSDVAHRAALVPQVPEPSGAGTHRRLGVWLLSLLQLYDDHVTRRPFVRSDAGRSGGVGRRMGHWAAVPTGRRRLPHQRADQSWRCGAAAFRGVLNVLPRLRGRRAAVQPHGRWVHALLGDGAAVQWHGPLARRRLVQQLLAGAHAHAAQTTTSTSSAGSFAPSRCTSCPGWQATRASIASRSPRSARRPPTSCRAVSST